MLLVGLLPVEVLLRIGLLLVARVCGCKLKDVRGCSRWRWMDGWMGVCVCVGGGGRDGERQSLDW